MKKTLKNMVEKLCVEQEDYKQSILETLQDIEPIYQDNEKYQEQAILEKLIIPDRIITFKVVWEDKHNHQHVNRGWRVQHSNVLGSYKGGLRFSSAVNKSILKALAFEQTFKCSLTNLSAGGAKGGADFNPKGKSDIEIRRFCQAYMNELYHYIGTEVDIPAGDIGVGTREIGYLFGQYLKLTYHFNGTLTGKHPSFGGSCGREESTGYGIIFFLCEMLEAHQRDIANQRILISGSGNVALHTAEMAIEKKAQVLTLSDRHGMLYFKNGLSQQQLDQIKQLKLKNNLSLKKWFEEDCNDKQVEYQTQSKPWHIKADIAIPCAVENEIKLDDIKALHKNGIEVIVEGSNMPLTVDALNFVEEHNLLYAPGKAANAGGVAVSQFERSQNAMHLSWSLDKVKHELQNIMQEIHSNCTKVIDKKNGKYHYKKGANIYAFTRIAEAMLSHGV